MSGSSPVTVLTAQAGLPIRIAHGQRVYEVVETPRHKLELRRIVNKFFTSASERGYDSQ